MSAADIALAALVGTMTAYYLRDIADHVITTYKSPDGCKLCSAVWSGGVGAIAGLVFVGILNRA